MTANQYVVSLVTGLPQVIAAARQRTTFQRISAEIGKLLEAPWALIAAQPDLRTDGHNVAMYWDDQGDGAIEVYFDDMHSPVMTATDPCRRVVIGRYPGYGLGSAAWGGRRMTGRTSSSRSSPGRRAPTAPLTCSLRLPPP